MYKISKSPKALFIIKIIFAILIGAYTIFTANHYSYSYLNEKYYTCISIIIFLCCFCKDTFDFSNLFCDNIFMLFKHLLVFFIVYSLILLVYKIPILLIGKILLGQFILAYIISYPVSYYTCKTILFGLYIPFFIGIIYPIINEYSISTTILMGITSSFLIFNILIAIDRKKRDKRNFTNW